MNYNELTQKIYAVGVRSGKWKDSKSEEYHLTMAVVAVAEAVRCEQYKDNEGAKLHLALAMVSLFDFAGYLQIDFARMSPIDYYRAYSRFSFADNAFGFIRGITKTHIIIERRVLFSLDYIREWANHLGFDIESKIQDYLMTYAEKKAVSKGA